MLPSLIYVILFIVSSEADGRDGEGDPAEKQRNRPQ